MQGIRPRVAYIDWGNFEDNSRGSVFTLPSLVHPGFDLLVRRSDGCPRQLCQGDIHMLTRYHLTLGRMQRVTNYGTRPTSVFEVILAPRPAVRAAPAQRRGT